jgi:excinuclease ABC subunit C
MKNSKHEIIYVGKAISLKNRVRQYFQSLNNQSAKVKSMVDNIHSFDYIVTDSELEALILECNLIKKNKPKYNILLRDDKTYPYIKITMNEKFPKVMKTRRLMKDKAKYFGPYTNLSALNETLQVIHEIYPIRTCKRNFSKEGEKKERPCLNFHIKKCMGPCTGEVDEKQYLQVIHEIQMFLSGKEDELIEKAKEKMKAASNSLDFEKAAYYREQISALSSIVEKQKVVSTNEADRDVIAAARGAKVACVQVFFIRKGKLIQSQHFILSADEDQTGGEILSSFMKQFYRENVYIPKEILIEETFEDRDIMEEWLSSKKGRGVKLKVPQKGDKKALVEMVKSNAQETMNKIKETEKRSKEESDALMKELQNLLKLKDRPNRIEAFDISNIQGVASVGSLVVFEGGKPINRDYRRFKIKSVEGPNDYASLEEVILRRYKRGLEETKIFLNESTIINEGKFSFFPDLIMVDGGLGQVSSVEKSLRALNLNIPVCGMVKDNKHRTKGLVFLGKEYIPAKNSSVFRFIYKVQEEAHRFALSYHRSLRKQNTLQSQLLEITSIGEARRKALMKHFKSIQKIQIATLEELLEVKGLNKKAAENIYNYYRNQK